MPIFKLLEKGIYIFVFIQQIWNTNIKRSIATNRQDFLACTYWYSRNAVDFIAPQNTLVIVAADGEVIFVSDDSNVGGPDPLYWNITNFITIRHSFGEYTDTTIWNIIVQK